MPARTYWKKRDDGSWEFLGAFGADHKPHPKSPQAAASILDVTNLDMQAVFARLALDTRESPPLLSPPKPIASRLLARVATGYPWEQLEGFIK